MASARGPVGLSASAGRETGEIQKVIVDPSGAAAHRDTGLCGQALQVPEEFLQGFGPAGRTVLQHPVELIDIGLEVFIVVIEKGLFPDGGTQLMVAVGERGEGIGIAQIHLCILLSGAVVFPAVLRYTKSLQTRRRRPL